MELRYRKPAQGLQVNPLSGKIQLPGLSCTTLSCPPRPGLVAGLGSCCSSSPAPARGRRLDPPGQGGFSDPACGEADGRKVRTLTTRGARTTHLDTHSSSAGGGDRPGFLALLLRPPISDVAPSGQERPCLGAAIHRTLHLERLRSGPATAVQPWRLLIGSTSGPPSPHSLPGERCLVALAAMSHPALN